MQTELVEVLALAREEPGFPLPRFRVAGGQVALTAAGVIQPATEDPSGMTIDYERLAELLAGHLATHLTTLTKPVTPTNDTTTITVSDVTELLVDVAATVDEGHAIRLRSEIHEVF
jgi:hypothetical protein